MGFKKSGTDAGDRRDVGGSLGRFTIGRRLGLLVGLLGAAVLVATAIGALGVGRVNSSIEDYYSGTFQHAATTVELRGALKSTELASLEYALIENETRRKQLRIELTGELVPAVTSALIRTEAALAESLVDEEMAAFARLQRNWQIYLERAGPALLRADLDGEQAAAIRVRRLLALLVSDADVIAKDETARAAATIESTTSLANSTQRNLIISALAAGLTAVAIAFLLTRSIVLRTRSYSRFAAGVAAGDFGGRTKPQGHDELTELGGLLNRMVEHREIEQTQGRRRSAFTEAMQLTGSEREAHDLLKRHLEKSIPGSTVTVLSRNNSANRLEPTTQLPSDDPMSAALDVARPRDCLAVRSGQVHDGNQDEALLTCAVCGEATASSCRPLLVGGEVIGAVLARRDHGLIESESETMRGSVVQAAPLLANLRNLALAELRAGTDSLTGLPNQRASHESMRRMAAQAERTKLPLSVLLLDLDHFKQVNDVYGHAEGDNVLAAVGVALRSTIREGDFCGRFGGEEFIALLPDTDLVGGGLAAEKIRSAVAAIKIPAVERDITVSIGVATIPDHGDDAAAVARIADRALYAAKSGGRNRVELAELDISAFELGLGFDAEPESPETPAQ